MGTMHSILSDDLGLLKKSARWVSKFLSEEQVRTCMEFVIAVQRCSLVMLANMVMMDKTVVSYHNLETKNSPNS